MVKDALQINSRAKMTALYSVKSKWCWRRSVIKVHLYVESWICYMHKLGDSVTGIGEIRKMIIHSLWNIVIMFLDGVFFGAEMKNHKFLTQELTCWVVITA